MLIVLSVGLMVTISGTASNQEAHDATLMDYLKHGDGALSEEAIVTQATEDTAQAINRLLSDMPEEAVRRRCLDTLALLLRSHNADVALKSRNALLFRAEMGDAYAVTVTNRLDRDAQPLLKKVYRHGRISFGNDYASLKDLYLLRMLRTPRHDPTGFLPRMRLALRDERMSFGPQVWMFSVHSADFSDRDLWILTGFDNLTYMDLSGSGVSGTGLRDGRWPNLEILHLAGCPVTDETVASVHLPSLVLVDLLETRIGKGGLRQLNLNSRGIKELWISSPKIEGGDLSVLQDYRILEAVRLHADAINPDAIRALSGCRNLRRISIMGPVQADLLSSLQRSVGWSEVTVLEKDE